MSFQDSHLGRLRAVVGPVPLLVPGAQVVVEDRSGRLLLQQRVDDHEWEVPAGSCEPGQSFTATAVAELQEETGLLASEADLVPFACLSDPGEHTLVYPNGDVVLAYAMCFLLPGVDAAAVHPRPDAVETRSVGWYLREDLPAPLRSSTGVVLALLERFRASGAFQAR
ncbi:NUDIX domain-containing protein [Aquipuribacter sp. MA13-6]|uniref:NUDIX domain-containing protein n=1 Tax=unclassified Aquipuribacter TaxID=2635084 RepID=UPI003EE9E39E